MKRFPADQAQINTKTTEKTSGAGNENGLMLKKNEVSKVDAPFLNLMWYSL